MITSFISAEALGVINTVDTFVFPNSFIKKDFNTTKPWIEYSYLIKNSHYVILSTVSITVEIDVSYQTQNESLLRQSIFTSSETFHDIQPGSVLHKSNNYSSSYFLLDNLNDLLLNISIENCDISSLALRNGKNCYFKDCSINVIHNFFSSGNVFENCNIGNPQALKEGIFEAIGFDKIILYIFLFLIVTFLPNIYFSIAIWRDYWALIGNAAVIVGLGLLYWFMKHSAKKDEKRPNIIK